MRRAFIGRDRELAELLAGLQDAAEGRGRLFLIAGGPGIGKTALADELARHAAGQGARALLGRCWEGGGAPPYWPWAQIIRSLVAGWDDDTLVAHLDGRAPHLAALVPDLADRLGHAATPVRASDFEAARFSMFEAAATLLRNASHPTPLMLVLDDLHAADYPSLLLLRFLARDVRVSPMLVVATYRTLEAARSPEAVAAFGDLVREGDVLSLDGLDRDEVSGLITIWSGIVPRERHVSEIHDTTAGNPLFVREVVRLLAQQGALEQPGRLRVPIPETVRAVIRRRLGSLSAEAIQVLSAAAVVGRDFDLALVAPASGLPADRVLGALSEAVAVGLVTEERGGVPTYRFSHPLMREAVYEGLPLPARLQLHRRVGEEIEDLYGPDSGVHLAQLAYHFAQVAATGEGAKALQYARKAGDRAMHAHAYEEAAVEYQRALHTLDSSNSDDALRCELLLRLGGACARAGDYNRAKGTYLQAAESARTIGSAEQLARAALGFGEPRVEGALVDRQLIALLQEALGVLSPRDHPLRVRLLARLSLEHLFSEEADVRDALSRDAVDMARRIGDVASLGSALRARWAALWGPDGLEERSHANAQLIELARQAGDRELELVGRVRSASAALEYGDIRQAEVEIAAHAQVADELRMPVHQSAAATMRAMLAVLRGAFEKGERLADRALSLQPERATTRFAHLYARTLIQWEQGRLADLSESLQQLAAQFPKVGLARAWLALAEAERGDNDAARTNLRRAVDGIPELARDGLWLPTVATAALASAQLNDRGAASILYPALAPYAARIIAFAVPEPVICLGSGSFFLALLATLQSRWDEAERQFEAAVSAHERVGARALNSRTPYEYARMLIRRGRAADRRRAAELIDQALAIARATGMTRVRQAAEQLRRLAAGEAVAAPQASDPVALPAVVGTSVFRREGDYWTVAYEGSIVRLRDSKGLRYLARLLAHPGREVHALDLEMAETGATDPGRANTAARTSSDDLQVRPDLGDAGELLDATARAAYKARLDELQAELDEAEAFNDPARAAQAKQEKEFLVAELARAVGLGGRDRRAASHAERARLNVTRAIRAAMANLARANPSLGEHLSSTIRTGRYCSYTPDPRASTVWDI